MAVASPPEKGPPAPRRGPPGRLPSGTSRFLRFGARRYHPVMTTTALPYTGDPESDALLAQSPLALLIGFTLDQQVTVQKAFSGPAELRRRAGTLDAAALAAIEPAAFAALFSDRPALHRFPGAMAGRVQALCATVASTYGGDASRAWTEASDARDLERRLRALPGIGEMKARTIVGVLARRLGVTPAGWEAVAPTTPTLADVDFGRGAGRLPGRQARLEGGAAGGGGEGLSPRHRRAVRLSRRDPRRRAFAPGGPGSRRGRR